VSVYLIDWAGSISNNPVHTMVDVIQYDNMLLRVGASKFMSIPNTWEDDPQSIKKMVIT
jgi:hypothetical protein